MEIVVHAQLCTFSEIQQMAGTLKTSLYSKSPYIHMESTHLVSDHELYLNKNY